MRTTSFATQNLARATFAEGIELKGALGLLGATMSHDMREGFCLPPGVNEKPEIVKVLQILQATTKLHGRGELVEDGNIIHFCGWVPSAKGIKQASRALVRAQLITGIIAHTRGKTAGVAAVAFGELTIPADRMREAGEATVAECHDRTLYITPGETDIGNLKPQDIRLDP